jgi:hypothetical protein
LTLRQAQGTHATAQPRKPLTADESQRHIGAGRGVTSPIQAGSTLRHAVAWRRRVRSIPAPPSETLHRPALPCLPRHSLAKAGHSATRSQIAEDRLPWRHERISFRQVPSAGRPRIRACLKIERGSAAGDFGCGRGGKARASPKRAVRAEPTKATGKRPAARRVLA